MFSTEVKANEIRQEAISEYKKEDEINELKEEVNRLLGKIKTLNEAIVRESVFGSTDGTRVGIYSNGDLFLGERYLDKEMGYYRTRMNKATIDKIPERHKISVLKIQKELMEEVLDNFPNEINKTYKITFRPIDKNDLQLMIEWLKKPYVHEWFANHKEITEDFVNCIFINGSEFVQRWIFQINGKDVGYIQNYFYEDDKDISKRYIDEIEAKNGSASLDFFIGDNKYIHKGYGKFIIKQFIEEKIFSNARCKNIIVGPRTKNIASIKSLEAIGFKWFKNVIDDKGRDEYMMELLNTKGPNNNII